MVGEERVTGVFYQGRGDVPGVRITFVTVEEQRRYQHLREVRHQCFHGVVYDLSAFAI